MLKRLRRFLGRQRLIPWIGEFKETLAQAAFWFTMVNFMMIAGTFYFTTVRHVLPWFKLPLFITLAIVCGVVILIVEFKFITPSIWAFRGKQMDLRNNAPQRIEDTPRIRRVYAGGYNSRFTRISRRRGNRKGYRRY